MAFNTDLLAEKARNGQYLKPFQGISAGLQDGIGLEGFFDTVQVDENELAAPFD